MLLVLALVLFGGWSFFKWIQSDWIEPGYVGVMYSATGGIEKDPAGKAKIYPPKRVYVPWMHQLYKYPTMIKSAEYTQDESAGESKSADGIQVTTSDNANTVFDVTVLYKVTPEDVLTVFNTFGPIPIADIQALHIRRAVKEACNDVGPKYDVYQLMGDKRTEASKFLSERLRTLLKPKGLTIVDAYFCQAYPPKQVTDRVTRTINSLTELNIAGIHNQIAEQERQAAVTKATAEAWAANKTATQASTKSVELLSLDADRAAIEKWGQAGGHLPTIQTRPGQNVFIPGNLPAEPAAAAAAAPAPAAQQSDDQGGSQ